MKSVRFIALILLCVISVTTLCGCFNNIYNLEIVNADASNMIRDDFYHDNYTLYANYYINDNELYITDVSYPESRIFLVKSQEEYNEIFSDDAGISVDFSAEMLVVYTFTWHNKREIKLTNAGFQNNIFEIELKAIEPFTLFWLVGDSCLPYQRYVVIKMDMIDVKNVNVTLNS